jgi:carbonic anhydrase
LDAKNYVTQKLSIDVSHAKRLELTEKISLLFQSKNLLTYPDVQKRVNEGSLFIRSWYYHLESGELEYFNTDSGEFEPMIGSEN